MWVFKASIRKILQLSSLTLQVRLKKKMLRSNSKISEESHILMAEIAMYPFTAFMSDIGGSAGLLLGLNVLGKICSHLTSFDMGGQTSPHFHNSSKNYSTSIPSD